MNKTELFEVALRAGGDLGGADNDDIIRDFDYAIGQLKAARDVVKKEMEENGEELE